MILIYFWHVIHTYGLDSKQLLKTAKYPKSDRKKKRSFYFYFGNQNERQTSKRRPKKYRDISVEKLVSTKDLGGKREINASE